VLHSYLCQAAVSIVVIFIYLQFVRRHVLDYKLDEAGLRLIFFGRIVAAAIPMSSLVDARVFGISEMLDPNNAAPFFVTRYSTRLIGTAVLLQRTTCLIRWMQITPDNAREFVRQFMEIKERERPIAYRSHADSGSIEAPNVSPMDTTGAGDILHGAFAYYFATTGDYPRSLAEAAEVASRSCAFFGTRAWMDGG